jgi:hypothetical protein
MYPSVYRNLRRTDELFAPELGRRIGAATDWAIISVLDHYRRQINGHHCRFRQK